MECSNFVHWTSESIFSFVHQLYSELVENCAPIISLKFITCKCDRLWQRHYGLQAPHFCKSKLLQLVQKVITHN